MTYNKSFEIQRNGTRRSLIWDITNFCCWKFGRPVWSSNDKAVISIHVSSIEATERPASPADSVSSRSSNIGQQQQQRQQPPANQAGAPPHPQASAPGVTQGMSPAHSPRPAPQQPGIAQQQQQQQQQQAYARKWCLNAVTSVFHLTSRFTLFQYFVCLKPEGC